jgi:uncharacterized protein (DUF305 family)
MGGLNGKEFEREFLKEYIDHHADAVGPLKECAPQTTHSELRELCQRVAPNRLKFGS